MREDNSGAMVMKCVGDDLADWKVCASFIAFIARHVKAVSFLIHMRDPQALATWVGFSETAGEEVACRREAVELQRMFGTLIPHAH